MNLYIDCQNKAFSTVEPTLTGRTVIEQVLPSTLPVDVVVSILSAIRQQAAQGVDIVYKITIN